VAGTSRKKHADWLFVKNVPNMGGASFVWNNLPRHLQKDNISRERFARDLETFLFARAYLSEAPLSTSVKKGTL